MVFDGDGNVEVDATVDAIAVDSVALATLRWGVVALIVWSSSSARRRYAVVKGGVHVAVAVAVNAHVNVS